MRFLSATPSGKPGPLEQAVAWTREGRRVALVTVVAAWKKAPCAAGDVMAVDERGGRAGAVCGGDVDDAAAHEALKCLVDDEPRLLRFYVANGQAVKAGAAGSGRAGSAGGGAGCWSDWWRIDATEPQSP